MTMRGRCRTLRRYYLRGYSRCYSLIRFAALSATPRAPTGPLSCFITCANSCILRSTLGQSGFNQQGLDAREVLLGKRPVLRWIAAPRNLYIPIQ